MSTARQLAGNIAVDKRKRLQQLDPFVLDNSLRESVVATSRGQSPEEKAQTFNAALQAGFKHIVVGAFGANSAADDAFVQDLLARPARLDGLSLYGFSAGASVTEVQRGRIVFDEHHIPEGLRKMSALGIQNPILEVDFTDEFSMPWQTWVPDWNVYTVQELADGIAFLVRWCRKNLASESQVFLNLRDFAPAMMGPQSRRRTLEFVECLADLPRSDRPYGLLCEENSGMCFPEEVGFGTAQVRAIMDAHDWHAPFLIHVHNPWGMGEATVMDALASGANGVWGSLSEEGVINGHCSSAVTIAGLVRLGNTEVLNKFNTHKLPKAAAEATWYSTESLPSSRQIVYGPRAIEAVFDFPDELDALAMGDEQNRMDRFTLASRLGFTHAPVRLTAASTPDMLVHALQENFGASEFFGAERATKMLAHMKHDQSISRQDDYSSAMGLALLYARTCTTSAEMPAAVQDLVGAQTKEDHVLLLEMHKRFLEAAVREQPNVDVQNPTLSVGEFYTEFLKLYYGRFTVPLTSTLFNLFEQHSGSIAWQEWRCWVLWTLRAYETDHGRPVITTCANLIATMYRKILLPHLLCASGESSEDVGPKVCQTPDYWEGIWGEILSGGPERWKDGEAVGNFRIALDTIEAHVPATGLRILVPLAGDSPFVHYAWTRGHQVTAIEKVPEAAAKLRRSFGSASKWTRSSAGGFDVWEMSCLGKPSAVIYVGDVFESADSLLGAHDVIMDKDAYGALEPERRGEYVRRLASYMRPSGYVYLEVKEKPVEERGDGPPWHIDSTILKEEWGLGGVALARSLGELYKLQRPRTRQLSYWLTTRPTEQSNVGRPTRLSSPTTSRMRLLTAGATPFGRKVVIALHEAGQFDDVDVVSVKLSPMAPGSVVPSLNPLGKIPTLELDDGTAIFDSRIITRYLDARAAPDRKIYPSGEALWPALVTEALGDGIMEAALLLTFEARLQTEEWGGHAVRPNWVDAQWLKIMRALDKLESEVDRFGALHMGHLACAAAIDYVDFRLEGKDVRADWRPSRPKLAAWLSQVASRPSMIASAPVGP